MEIQHFFDPDTSTLTYAVFRGKPGACVIFDPVWNFDPASGKLSEHSANGLCAFLESERLTPEMVIETHAHADHLTAAQILKQRYPGLVIGISERIKLVQATFQPLVGQSNMPIDGRQFDRLFGDDELIEVAGLKIRVIPLPGHTPACTGYGIDDAVFTGDAIFMPDSGTGRCDFPGGSARTLYKSITNRLYRLPDSTRIFVGHDYQPGGRALAFETTVGAQKLNNIHLPSESTEAEFVKLREGRDVTLNAPRLLWPSIQVNINAGRLPDPESGGRRFLKIPLT